MNVKHSVWPFEELYDEREVASKFDSSPKPAIQEKCRVQGNRMMD